ncbi:MAG: YfhO family protein, partial [Chitinophagales bacterium]|nr:YfhO family protein [Chitinophagales bacterium]
IVETFTLMIPNFSGGPEVIKKVDEKNEIVKTLSNQGVPVNNAMQLARQLPTYWGNQPFVAGTTYISAILIFLTFLGFVLLKDNRKWWLLATFIITLFVAWGNNFSIFYKLLFNYLPFFNKFRTPSMIFYLTTIITVMASGLFLQHLVNQATQREMLWNRFFKVALGFLCFMVILTLLGPSLFSFTNDSDVSLRSQLLQVTQNNQQMADAIFNGLLSERKSMMRADALRSSIFIFLTTLAITAYLKRKVSAEIMLGAIAVLLLVDIIGVDRRYVTHDSYQSNAMNGIGGPQMTGADMFILKDKDPDYRVLDLTVNAFNDAKPSYFHKNIGGYHSAKLKRYQDIISFQFNDNLKALQEGNLAGAQVLNMLNTRYIITKPDESGVFTNEYAYGSAWLVKEVKVLDGPVAVFDDLMKEDLLRTALLEHPTKDIASNKEFVVDSNAHIQLEQYSNDKLVYSFTSEQPAYVVFSEIYYNSGKGWSAYIDGSKVSHDQVDYVLRGLAVPAGKHEIVFQFDTPTLEMASKIDLASSVLILLLAVGVIAERFLKRKKEE